MSHIVLGINSEKDAFSSYIYDDEQEKVLLIYNKDVANGLNIKPINVRYRNKIAPRGNSFVFVPKCGKLSSYFHPTVVEDGVCIESHLTLIGINFIEDSVTLVSIDGVKTTLDIKDIPEYNANSKINDLVIKDGLLDYACGIYNIVGIELAHDIKLEETEQSIEQTEQLTEQTEQSIEQTEQSIEQTEQLTEQTEQSIEQTEQSIEETEHDETDTPCIVSTSDLKILLQEDETELPEVRHIAFVDETMPIWYSNFILGMDNSGEAKINLDEFYQAMLMHMREYDVITLQKCIFSKLSFETVCNLEYSMDLSSRVSLGIIRIKDTKSIIVAIVSIDSTVDVVRIQVVSPYCGQCNIDSIKQMVKSNYTRWKTTKQYLARG